MVSIRKSKQQLRGGGGNILGAIGGNIGDVFASFPTSDLSYERIVAWLYNNDNNLRLRKQQKSINMYRLSVFVSCIILIGYIIYSILSFIIYGSSGTSSGKTTVQTLQAKAQIPPPNVLLRSNHVQLIDEENGGIPFSDTLNAAAQDIYDVLDCESLLSSTLDEMKNNRDPMNEFNGNEYESSGDQENNNNLADDEMTAQQRRRRRRLLDQHGDDGGFGTMDREQGGNNMMDDGVLPEEEEKWGQEAEEEVEEGQFEGVDDWRNAEGEEGAMLDDFGGGGGGGGGYGVVELTAQHLFCLAATNRPEQELVDEFACPVTQSSGKRKLILHLWSSARTKMSLDVLQKVVKLGKEYRYQTLLDRTYDLWAPSNDEGFNYMIGTINSYDENENGGIRNLKDVLGDDAPMAPGKISNGGGGGGGGGGVDDGSEQPPKTFVDVGSCLGLTTLAIHQLYPKTKIISIEPAAPNWFYQELNLRCNLQEHFQQDIKVMLGGVGPNNEYDEDEEDDVLMSKVMWRPTATTSTRAWTPESEHLSTDIELTIELRHLNSYITEANKNGKFYNTNNNYNNNNNKNNGNFASQIATIDVLNVDCEGCEYNVIPALSKDEFDSISTIMGGMHWGYIPTDKLPSSKRGEITHERLCQHEIIAKTTKECCAFPDLVVKSKVPGELLLKDTDEKEQNEEDTDDGDVDVRQRQRQHPRQQHLPPMEEPFTLPESTVSDIIQDGLCDDFEQWADVHYLFGIQDDWGWMELTSQAKSV